MTETKSKILFHFPVGRVYLPDRQRLKHFLVQLFKKEAQKVSQVNYVFCSESELLQLNKKYLHHNTHTDIITFPFHTIGEPILSDVYISISRVKENAQLFKTTQTNELYRVIFHGALHLCGYGDKTTAQKKKMKELEDFYLRLYCST
jgi:rRNA maturation RNase YbeY